MKKIHINNDDNYATPPEFYEELNKRFNFDFDPCPYNTGEITPDVDGLLINWGGVNFVNPPYSRALKEAFVKRAVEFQRQGQTSVLLLPVSTSTILFHDTIKPNATEIRFVRGRIKFQKRDIDGNLYTPGNGGMHDSMLIILKP